MAGQLDANIVRELRKRKYTQLEIIGEGRFGKVASGQYFLSENQKLKCAVKIMQRDEQDGEKLFHREVVALSLAVHPNAVRILQYFKLSRAFVITMEWCEGGNLDTLLAELPDRDFFPLDFSMTFCKDLASVLHFLHDEHNLTHRDLKPENVLFDQHRRVKLADFGFAKVADSLRNTNCGTDRFKPPELLRYPAKPNHDPKKIDIWGWGLLCYLVHTKRMPFPLEAINSRSIKPLPLDIKPKLLREEAKGTIPSLLLPSLKYALKEDPNNRTSMCTIVQQVWYTGQQ